MLRNCFNHKVITNNWNLRYATEENNWMIILTQFLAIGLAEGYSEYDLDLMKMVKVKV